MNYSALFKGLLGEAKALKQYRRLPTAIRVLACIGTIPFIFLTAAFFIAYAVYGFFFNVIASSVAYLEAWLHGESKDVRHATEAVLYFVAMPTIFMMQVLLSFFACAYFVVWFCLQCVLYVATLGGIRFQPYINTASYGAGECGWEMRGSVTGLISVVSVIFSLFVLRCLLYIINASGGSYEIASFGNVIGWIYTIFSVIGIACCAKKTAAKDEPTDELPAYDDEGELELPEV